MADRYDDRDRYRDPARERSWGRLRERDDDREYRSDDYRRESRGEFLQGDRDWNNQFDRGDRDRDYGREGYRGNTQYGADRRYGDEKSEFGHATRDEWRYQDQSRQTGQNLGGGMGSYSGPGWDRERRSGFGGGMSEGFNRDRDWDRGERSWSQQRTSSDQTGTTGLSTWGSQGMIGRYVGRGPKGYQRSDERIREDVCERLTMHPDVDASDIEIQVSNGEVTLLGSVEDRHQKHMAEDVIEGMSGVRDVNNQIRVNRSLGQRMSDALGLSGDRDRERERHDTRTLNVTGANPALTEPNRR